MHREKNIESEPRNHEWMCKFEAPIMVMARILFWKIKLQIEKCYIFSCIECIWSNSNMYHPRALLPMPSLLCLHNNICRLCLNKLQTKYSSRTKIKYFQCFLHASGANNWSICHIRIFLNNKSVLPSHDILVKSKIISIHVSGSLISFSHTIHDQAPSLQSVITKECLAEGSKVYK